MSDPLVSCIMLSSGPERSGMLARAKRSYDAQTYPNRNLVLGCYPKTATIGEMRNCANAASPGSILCHWDDDDYSHPDRIYEQVALLQSSGADCVGYNECLFWDMRKGVSRPLGQAWLYGNSDPRYCLGSSMMYWRKTWERVKFDDVSHGEDERFRAKIKSVGLSSLSARPRMICSIHDSNTSVYRPEAQPTNWQRVAGLDAYCERTMKL